MSNTPAVNRASAAAVQLRLSGASWGEVADVMGVQSPVAARRMVEAELAARSTEEAEGREALRNEMSAQLSSLLQSVWNKAHDDESSEHLPAIRTAMTILDRKAKLLGLDAPSEVIVHTPTQQELDSWVAAMTHNPIHELEEADIVDAVVIE